MTDLDQARTHHADTLNTLNGVRGKAAAAQAALIAAQTGRRELLKAAGRGEAVKPGDLAAAALAVASAETDHGAWSEAATIAANAERDAHRQLSLETQVQNLLDYRGRCEARAEMADAVAEKIRAAREALKTLERLDAEVAASAPKHIIVMGGLNTIAARLLPPLDGPSLRSLYAAVRQRDDVLAGFQALPSGTGHLAQIDLEIRRAREVAMLDAKRRAA
ncbi:MAG TPA: hypothetical protein PLX84_13475 [Acidiphilium sp.]|nr:MAG: hypothetical protein B7Z57_09775 [Acidiphilium sp. 37-60-79]HQT74942.1 hypothetical protein [Acidiphilium sp.]